MFLVFSSSLVMVHSLRWLTHLDGGSSSFLHCTLNKEIRFVLTQFETIVMERIRKPLHYILVVYTRVLYGRSFIDLVHLPLGLWQVGPKCGWLTFIQPKAGAVKAPELSPYYSSIYISGSLSASSLGFALSTRSLHYIYVTPSVPNYLS